MKKLVAFGLLLSLGVFITACNKADTKKDDKMAPPATGGDAPADAPAGDAAPAENK